MDVLRALGASVRVCPDSGMVSAQAPLGGLVGADFRLRFPSVGATETAVMAAALAMGRSVIRNTAREPEVEVRRPRARCVSRCPLPPGGVRAVAKPG